MVMAAAPRYPHQKCKINPQKKHPENDTIAYFPASTLPQPDFFGPYPTDRDLGLEIAKNAESVDGALKRRAAGSEVPKEYIPSYKKRDDES